MAKSSDVILVHGAWADGSSWAKVIPLLAARGHSVTAVQLPLTSLRDDVATVKRAIALASGPLILAGHSYGGAVISEAGNDPKVEALVYIAAFARTRVSRQDLSVRASSLRRWVRKSALTRRGI